MTIIVEEFTAAAVGLLDEDQTTPPGDKSDIPLLEKRNKRLDQRKQKEKEVKKSSAREKNEKKLLYERHHIIPDFSNSATFEAKLRKIATSGGN